MATLFTAAPFDLNAFDLGVIWSGYRDSFLRNDISFLDRTFANLLVIERQVDPEADIRATLLAGSDFVLTENPFESSGLVTSLFDASVNQESYGISWGILDVSIPLVDVIQASLTTDGSDDRALLDSLLSGDDGFRLGAFDDIVFGGAGNDLFLGGGGDDVLTGEEGNDLVAGGVGLDTSVYLGDAGAYTVTISADAVTVADRLAGRDDTDTLISIETLRFADRDWQLSLFDGAASLAAADFSALTEMYIAYFNRAPDAQGLLFWADSYAQGLPLTEIARYFFDSQESRAAYPNPGDTLFFVETVYNNVLGRASDPGGLAYWVDILDRDITTPEAFILNVLDAAKAHTADRLYLENKTDLGLYFSAIRGLSNAENAREVMDLYTGSAESILAARSAIDAYHDLALDPETGAFLVQLAGVVPDPFAVA